MRTATRPTPVSKHVRAGVGPAALDHRGAVLIGASLPAADLTGANLRGALLIGADLTAAADPTPYASGQTTVTREVRNELATSLTVALLVAAPLAPSE